MLLENLKALRRKRGRGMNHNRKYDEHTLLGPMWRRLPAPLSGNARLAGVVPDGNSGLTGCALVVGVWFVSVWVADAPIIGAWVVGAWVVIAWATCAPVIGALIVGPSSKNSIFLGVWTIIDAATPEVFVAENSSWYVSRAVVYGMSPKSRTLVRCMS